MHINSDVLPGSALANSLHEVPTGDSREPLNSKRWRVENNKLRRIKRAMSVWSPAASSQSYRSYVRLFSTSVELPSR